MSAEGAPAREGPALAGPSRFAVADFVLGAVTVGMLAELLRALFPLLYALAEDIGFLTAAGVVPLLFLAPVAAVPLRALLSARVLLAGCVAGMVACRITMQATQPGLVLAAVGAMLGFVAVGGLAEIAREAPEGGRADGRWFAAAALAGLLLDTTIRLAFATWDVAWQSGPWPWAACLGMPALGAAALAAYLRRPQRLAYRSGNGHRSGREQAPETRQQPDSTRPASLLPLAAFGVFLALELLVFASPALVASATGTSLAVAGGAVLVGFALGFAVLATERPARWPRAQSLVWGAGLACWSALAVGPRPPDPSEPLLLGIIVIGQVWAVSLLGQAMQASPAQPPVSLDPGGVAGWRRGGWRTSAAAGLASLLLVAVLLPYQIHYELPLPFPNWLLLVAAALLLGVAAARGGRRGVPTHGPKLAFAGTAASLCLLAVPLGLGLTSGSAVDPASGSSFRLVSYNIHQAVDVRGHLDPAAVARVIERQDADVVLLQEVGRGWPLSGTMDAGTWLADRRAHV